MTEESLEHRIRVSLGKMFHHNHKTQSGDVDIEGIASEHGVSNDQVREQIAYLKSQDILSGPMALEGAQVSGVPGSGSDNSILTATGLGWAESGYPAIL
jgi:hypothetical protein